MQPQVPDGLAARFNHFRYPLRVTYSEKFGGTWEADQLILKRADELKRDGFTPAPNGGVTQCELYELQPDGKLGELRSIGVARCCPRDNFNRRLGRTIALGRALKELKS